MVTLLAASRIHSRLAAIHSADEYGIANKPRRHSTAPIKKYGVRRP